MRTKSQGNEVILSTYLHPNLIRTTPLLIKFCLPKIQNPKSIKLNQNHHLLQDTFNKLTLDQQSNSSKPVQHLPIVSKQLELQ